MMALTPATQEGTYAYGLLDTTSLKRTASGAIVSMRAGACIFGGAPTQTATVELVCDPSGSGIPTVVGESFTQVFFTPFV